MTPEDIRRKQAALFKWAEAAFKESPEADTALLMAALLRDMQDWCLAEMTSDAPPRG